VHRVVWNNGNGLASSALLASGTSSGLCRIDVLWGRWLRDKVPYQGLEGLRMEDGNLSMDVDSESSEGSE
jgi:transcription factor C subunit 6